MMTQPELSRSVVYGRRAMAASSQPLATAAGLEILRQGGSAADAAVAMAAALNVTEPTSTGIGGDAFALYYKADEKRVYALNGSGRSPAGLSLQRLKQEGLGENLPATHPYTVTVPGACAAWCDLQQRFGVLSLADDLQPAIRLADEGFPVAPITAWFWQKAAGKLLNSSLNGHELLINGRGPGAGEIFRNEGLARTLRLVAEQGKAGFYQGAPAAAIARVVQQAGGCLTEADLAAHTSTWEEPISTVYRGVRVWECPPNGQGLAALLALQILEQWDVASLPVLSAERLHLQIEAMRLAFLDARAFVADPLVHPAPLKELLSAPYAQQRSRLIQAGYANPAFQPGRPIGHSETVYFCVVDDSGNACSFINSNYMGFGTGIVPAGWGFSLQNRGHNFSLQAEHPNCLEPGKRPYHTIIPGMATHLNGELYGPFGVMGGFMQPQGHMQVVSALLDDGVNAQQALERPRFCIEPDSAISQVALEAGIARPTADQLQQWGHDVRMVSGMERALFGRGQIIRRVNEGTVWEGGSDPRADGCAMTL